jgi:sugar/nucleoside kinase (ribokinase family)
LSILTIGTVAFDAIETPFDKVDRILGGSATYSALAARYFADTVRVSAVVGGDFPSEYLDLLSSHGLNLDGLDVIPDGKTFFWAGRYHLDLNGRDTLTTDLNVLAGFNPVLPETYRDTRILCLGNLDPKIQLSVLDQVDSPDLVICDTMNYWIDSTLDELHEVLSRVDVLIINDEEARQLAGESNIVRSANAIRRMGPKILVIKKGEHGAMLFLDGSVFCAPALPLEEIVDPTGAGDTFMGGFAGYLGKSAEITDSELKRAVICGSTMASFCVEQFGPDNLLNLTEDRISDRMETFRSLSEIPSPAIASA